MGKKRFLFYALIWFIIFILLFVFNSFILGRAVTTVSYRGDLNGYSVYFTNQEDRQLVFGNRIYSGIDGLTPNYSLTSKLPVCLIDGLPRDYLYVLGSGGFLSLDSPDGLQVSRTAPEPVLALEPYSLTVYRYGSGAQNQYEIYSRSDDAAVLSKFMELRRHGKQAENLPESNNAEKYFLAFSLSMPFQIIWNASLIHISADENGSEMFLFSYTEAWNTAVTRIDITDWMLSDEMMSFRNSLKEKPTQEKTLTFPLYPTKTRKIYSFEVMRYLLQALIPAGIATGCTILLNVLYQRRLRRKESEAAKT